MYEVWRRCNSAALGVFTVRGMGPCTGLSVVEGVRVGIVVISRLSLIVIKSNLLEPPSPHRGACVGRRLRREAGGWGASSEVRGGLKGQRHYISCLRLHVSALCVVFSVSHSFSVHHELGRTTRGGAWVMTRGVRGASEWCSRRIIAA